MTFSTAPGPQSRRSEKARTQRSTVHIDGPLRPIRVGSFPIPPQAVVPSDEPAPAFPQDDGAHAVLFPKRFNLRDGQRLLRHLDRTIGAEARLNVGRCHWQRTGRGAGSVTAGEQSQEGKCDKQGLQWTAPTRFAASSGSPGDALSGVSPATVRSCSISAASLAACSASA